MLVVADRWSATSEQMVSVIDGIILVGGMCWYIRHLIRTSGGSDDTYEHAQASILATSFYTIIGIGLLVVGSKFLVDSSIYIATYFGLSERVIGLTIIAVGTSLPELATTIIAGIRKQHEIAFGNIVGSNIFNILWILGFTALVKQIPVSVAATHDLGVVLIATLALFALIHTGRKYVLERWQGGLMVGLYITYIGYILSAGQ
jgi:cation:H+ antiporter